jgi:signal peptidase II
VLRRRLVSVALAGLIIATIGCDQVSKRVASVHLADSAGHSFLGDALRLQYEENRGGFLSIGADLPEWARTAIFSVGSGLALLAYVISALTLPLDRIALVGLCLLFAGGLSNLVDRLLHGRVIDFLNIGVGPLRTGIFNVADVAVMIGAVVLMVAYFRTENRRAEVVERRLEIGDRGSFNSKPEGP